ncbi:hypothetical protein UFOVP54_241 [uncultured Caudovirales phage]|uniref:Uncharacterized protein n=1 Tax=uncultured Caudovirales phage TaxID=2100421 RepID=A0A6J5KXV2_9CAUD|nr:hypothetical protein UFOVP54_241 [uncultured Caudovirales phage]
MKNSLAAKGLSMSQAASISNLCNQRSKDITAQLADINNVSKELVIGEETYTEVKGNPIPQNVVELLTAKARLSATQAFLMENIKAKDELINKIKYEGFEYDVAPPIRSQTISETLPNEVDEDFGWDTLTAAEYNEFIEAEAYASHIGQFIHKGGKLDRLRAELPTIKTLEFMEIEVGKKTPMKITVHHTPAQLLTIHEELAALHRGYEQKVNYFKSKIKNAVTSTNAAVQKARGDIQARVNQQNLELANEYKLAYDKWLADQRKAQHEFEEKRQGKIQDAVNLKIEVAERFQPVVDEFLNQLK